MGLEAGEGLRALLSAPFLAPFHTLLLEIKGFFPVPEGQLPGPWVKAACVCAANVLLGHEHDFRVKHLSEALNDKHRPLAGEYRSPAQGSQAEPSKQPPDACSALRMGLACGLAPTPGSSRPQVSLPLVTWECMLGPWGLARGAAAAGARKAGRRAGGSSRSRNLQLALPGACPCHIKPTVRPGMPAVS